MVQLDTDLLFAAHRITDGANVHNLNEMIIAYKQAVYLHNSGWRGHEKYQHQHELRLRIHICNHRLNQLNARIRTEESESRRLVTSPDSVPK
jgi:hypothetical protein